MVPVGDPARRSKGGRAILRDPNTCLFVVSEGYWKVRPPVDMTDMTGMGETSAAAVYDSSKPLPPPPP